MKLSPNFWLHEFTRSQTAARSNPPIDNTPDENIIDNLKILAKGLESVRALLDNKPITITSGYRCHELNSLLGSKKTSKHTMGLAADWHCNSYANVGRVFEVVAESDVLFDQIILEFHSPEDPYSGWIHVSFPKEGDEPRRQKLVIDRSGTRTYS